MNASHPDGVTLSEYVDEALPAPPAAEVREHLASCAECQRLVQTLRDVKRAAQQLPQLEPRREVWTRLERTLRANPRRQLSMQWSWLAAAAAVLLAVFIGYRLADVHRQPAAPAPAASASAEASDAAAAQFVEAELRQAEEHYQKAFTRLQQSMNDGKGSLDPQTAATLEKNLAVVDQAISESRAALRAQPTSAPAQASLLESFKSKITLLEDTVALINEMRNGPTLKPKGT